ncbi:MAG: hypothetical protein ACNYWU_11980 [Desulfobacterales bacterium]
MFRLFKRSLLVILLIAVFSATAFAAKITVCHVPPGNPSNFHDITISENALQAHLDHGDFVGSCLENCAALCDDGDACTQDYVTENGECVCLEQHPPVDCDDSNPCTADSCDSVDGCEYDLITMNGTACDDGDPETTNDVCTDGVCAGTSGPQTGCPCMDQIDQIPEFADFVYNIDPNMTCSYCDPPGFLKVQSPGAIPPEVYLSWTFWGSQCGYRSSPTSTNFLNITPAQANVCKAILDEAAANAQLE